VLGLKSVQEFKRPLWFGLATAVLTAGITLLLPNYYRSEAHLLPTETRGMGGMGQLAAAAAALGVGIPSHEGADDSYVDILNSRWVRESLLSTEFEFGVKAWPLGSRRPRKETLAQYLHSKNPDRGILDLAALYSASRDMKTKLLTIHAETKSPELSQQIVQQATSLLEIFILTKERTRGGDKARFTKERLEEVKNDYAKTEEEFRRFLEVNRNYRESTDPSVRLRGSRIEGDFTLKRELVASLSLSREQALIDEKNDMPILNLLDRGNLPYEKSRPARSMYVLLAFFLTVAGVWLMDNRKKVWSFLESQAEGS